MRNKRDREPAVGFAPRHGVAYVLAWIFAGLAAVTVIVYVALLWTDVKSADDVRTMFVTQMYLSAGDLIAGTVGICLSFSATLFMFVTFREQRRQFDASRRDAGKDRFETTFFNMLAMLYNVRESVNAEITRRTDGSMTSMSDYYEGFHRFFSACASRRDLAEIEVYLAKETPNNVELEMAEQTIGVLYDEYMQTAKCNIGYYYRYVFNTINFVVDHCTGLPDGEAEIHRYLNMLQSQMSDDELGLIFYDAISRRGLDKNYERRFKALLDDSGFLENINSGALLSRAHHRLYRCTVFRFLSRDERAVKACKCNR